MKHPLRTISLLLLFSCSALSAADFVFTPINASHGLSDNQIRYILQLPDGRMVFTTSGNLNLYDGTDLTYIHRSPHHIHPLKQYNGFYRIYLQGDSLLWIKDMHKLLCADLRTEKYRPHPNAHFRQKGIHVEIEDLFIDHENRIWLLSGQKLFQEDGTDTLFIDSRQGHLQDLATKDGRLYLFFHTGTVACHDLRKLQKQYERTAYPQAQQALFGYTSLVVPGEEGFYQLRNGRKGGFFFFDTRKRRWEKLLETDYTLNTLILRDQAAYISCTDGLWTVHCPSGKKPYMPLLKTIDGQTIHTEISTLFHDRQGGFWLGTLNQGLLYHHPARYRFARIGKALFPRTSTEDISVQAFAEDPEGNLYIRTRSGLYRYRPHAETHPVLTAVEAADIPAETQKALHSTRPTEYRGETYTALHTDHRGWTWAGTRDGLRLIRPTQPKDTVFYTENGLPNNFIHAILEDRNGHIWISTSHGISRIETDPTDESIRFIHFNRYDGVLDGEYTQGAAYEGSDGTLYFGGINGCSILRPKQIFSPLPAPRPVFTGLQLLGEKVEIGKEYKGHTILTQAAPYTKELHLAYDQNFFTLTFSALNYHNPSKTHYRYQLEGIDTDWQETTSPDGLLRAAYTGLGHGSYRFRIMASANGKDWSGTTTELLIHIHAPWWKTTAAYILYGLILLALLVGSLYAYLRSIRTRMQRRHKEEILLLRIRNLIEQCRLLEEERESRPAPSAENRPKSALPDKETLPEEDATFLTRAMELVEKNMSRTDYSVEQLSKDLCMDRTGLYRKLIALLDQSPSLFIRHIRLQKAAQLILEGKRSIAEIADLVGFSSPSYLSKCFQEAYGCRPSEYAEKEGKST